MGYMDNSSSQQSSNTGWGGQQSPGLFGNGTYQVNPYQINNAAFTNPAGTGASEYNTAMNNMLGATTSATAPSIGPASTSQGAGNIGQLGVANQEMNIANGNIPSLAAITAAQQGQQAQQANLSAMGSARGNANPALSNYILSNQNANVQNQVAQNAVAGKTAEQMQALSNASQSYSGVTQNQQFNAQQIQQNAIQQAQLEAQQRGLNAQQYNDYISTRAQQLAQTMQASQAGQSLNANYNLGLNNTAAQAFESSAGHQIGGQLMGIAGGAASGVASTLAKTSDMQSKKKIKPAKNLIDKFLSSLPKSARI